MQLIVTPTAATLFQHEWGFDEGDEVRVFVRYSGFSESGPYSFGIMKDAPIDPAVMTEAGGIHFYMEKNDLWFLEEQKLTIDRKQDEIVFVRE